MDFDDAKENIQPLAQGRNASILQASLRVESPLELLAQRKVLEKEIHNYSGDDPLSVWYNYIEWIEQSYPSGGKESGLQEVLSKCLEKFENDERYKQDRRMIKLYIKFIDSQKDPAEYYQQLFSAGIGTMVADFYIAWAYCYDLTGNTLKADEIFARGIACRAQPLEELHEARQHFGFAVAQRFMYKDDDPVREETNRQLNERRMALTSLRAHRRNQIVGSIRTGSAIKSVSPGRVKVDLPSTSYQHGNKRIQVFKDENEKPNVVLKNTNGLSHSNEVGKSVVSSIIDAARNQENLKEPGPWRKIKSHKKGKLFGSSKTYNELGFDIHEDGHDDGYENIKKPCIPPIPITENELRFDKPFIYLPNFCGISKPTKIWITPVTTEEVPDANALPEYNKCKLYPRPNIEFQPEELKAYNILKKRGIQNVFTKERDVYWGSGPLYNIRLYPHFATKSKPQPIELMDQNYIPEKFAGLKVAFDEIYNGNTKTELQFEEILASRIRRNETIIETADMEETLCATSERIQRRKSFFPIRKSLALSNFKTLNRMSVLPEQNEKNEKHTENGSTSITATLSADTKVLEDKLKTNPPIHPENTKKTSETEQETLIAEVSKISLKDGDSNVSMIQKQSDTTDLQPKLAVEGISNAALIMPFEIFIDESSVETKCSKNVPDGNEFQFKTPALPIANATSIAVVPSKLPFQIYDDENLLKQTSCSLPKPDFDCGVDGFFDADETCSTQNFNIYLKAQSVSTPIAVTKLKPQKQFGNILKEISPISVPEQKDDLIANKNSLLSDQSCTSNNENLMDLPPTTVAYSPPRQQLSTILETSEHGTTQGTHTTGATTKSTISSPDFDVDSQVQTIAHADGIQQQPVLETVKELSYESFADKITDNLKIENIDNSTKFIKTPGSIRLQNKCTTECLESSVFENSRKTDQRKVGDFSRLEENEDTVAGYVLKALPPIRFQDDKTETISKMLITSQQFKFPEEKTETVSKIMFEPEKTTKFEEDKTETISKILVDPPQPFTFPDDNKTDTISKNILAPPELVEFYNEKTELKIMEKDVNQPKDVNQDNFLRFFGQTPPKQAKQLVTKQTELSKVRTATNFRTPLKFEAKRFCGKDTTEKEKAKVLFDDELKTDEKNDHSFDMRHNVKDSFLSDFLIINENQQALPQNKIKTKSKSVFRDSFIPDLSLIDDSEHQTKQAHFKYQQKAANESILPDFSFIQNTQPKSSKPEKCPLIEDSQTNQFQLEIQQKSTNKSILPEFSFIKNTQPSTKCKPEQNKSQNLSDFFEVPETQSNESIIKSSQQTEHHYFKQSYKQPSPLKNNFKTNLKDNKDDVINWKPTSEPTVGSQNVKGGTTLKNILMDSFIQGFSDINKPSIKFNDIKQTTTENQSRNNSLMFLNESLKQKSENFKNIPKSSTNNTDIPTSKGTKQKFVAESSKEKFSSKEKILTGVESGNFFELNCETEMFGTNISMIKNSTWLPNHGPSPFENAYQSQIPEKSLHIKSEEISLTNEISQNQVLKTENSSINSKFRFNDKSHCNNNLSIELRKSELAAIKSKSIEKNTEKPIIISEYPEENNENENEISIYYKHTPKTPKLQVHIWDDMDANQTSAQNHYIHAEPDLNQTHQVIENIVIDPNVNPFNVDLINAFLERVYVISYLENLSTCKLVGRIQRLKHNATIDINGVTFTVMKLIGEGAYGSVYRGKENKTGKVVAMKQEKPPNLWEYYICLEIQERIRADELLQAFMSVDYALIGNNSSILISKFSQYGSLITVCNKIKKRTMKNVDEYVVMLLVRELLEIMDHLHAVNIIHADVKADNFLLMNKLTYPPTVRHLQLIDFGVSIDMKLFKEGQTFSYVHNSNSFKCPEMREGRPWTYQLDLYGIASVIHVLLFGKYMDIERITRGFWMHKTHVPRYLNKSLWDEIFKTLLNVRDCKSMPDLQELRALLKKEIEEKERYVLKMVNEFNTALTM